MKQLDYNRLLKTDWVNQFTESQRSTIAYAVELQLDVGAIANPKYSPAQMNAVFQASDAGLDVGLINPTWTTEEITTYSNNAIREKLTGIIDNMDDYNPHQLYFIAVAHRLGLELTGFLNPNLDADDMHYMIGP